VLNQKGCEKELSLMRAMWRVAGAELLKGTTIHLGSLPARFRDERRTFAMLQRLESNHLLVSSAVGAGWLVTPYASAEELFREAIWRNLEYRRRVEFAKLQAMQNYTFINSCRRAFLLRYFGDPSARVNCGGCDNCTNTSPLRSSMTLPPGSARKAPLQTKLRLAQVRGASK
jgi:ATP-dependent DNA helicase RecQ